MVIFNFLRSFLIISLVLNLPPLSAGKHDFEKEDKTHQTKTKRKSKTFLTGRKEKPSQHKSEESEEEYPESSKSLTNDSDEEKGASSDSEANSGSGIFASDSQNEEIIDSFEQAFLKNIQKLADTFHESEIPEGAMPRGEGHERVLIALSVLLMEQTGCAAIFMSPLGDKQLWITGNKLSEKKIKNSIDLFIEFIEQPIEPHRSAMIKSSPGRKILNFSTSRRARKDKQKRAVVTSTDKMCHWLKKPIILREHLKEKSELGEIARSLVTKNIKYIKAKGPHAEMNILDELHKNDLLHVGCFIAISKKCCMKCAAAIQAVNETYDVMYQANGCHFNIYEWPIPNFLREEESVLEKFLGKEAFQIFQDNPEKKEEFFGVIDKYKTESKKRTYQEATPSVTPNEFTTTSDDGAPTIKKEKLKTKKKKKVKSKKKGKDKKKGKSKA